jgi:hypothetical protein
MWPYRIISSPRPNRHAKHQDHRTECDQRRFEVTKHLFSSARDFMRRVC